MKIIFRSAVITAFLIVTSCGKETAQDIVKQLEEETELLEKTPLEANQVSDNVVIEGATKHDGLPPTPNEAISLDVSNAEKNAVLNEGFNIPLSSDGAITGAYVQFKSDDGTMADSYYDIDITANLSNSGKSGYRNLTKKGLRSLAAKVDGITLDIDFNSTIEPGTFCYEICVYDNEGNISAPQEVCVTVESWGGSQDVVGTWHLVKEIEKINGITETLLPGDIDCAEDSTVECDGGGQVTASYYCYITESLTVIFNADGTYEFDSKDTDKELDVAATKASCEAVYEEFNDDYLSKGNWAYVQAEKRLIMVEYQYTEDYQGEIETHTYSEGDAPLLFEGEAKIEGGSFIISIDEDSNDSYKVYLEK